MSNNPSADRLIEFPIRPYLPANGFEGMEFMERFCFRCKREWWSGALDDDEGKCEILTQSMIGPEGPKEWLWNVETFESWCSAFEPEDK